MHWYSDAVFHSMVNQSSGFQLIFPVQALVFYFFFNFFLKKSYQKNFRCAQIPKNISPTPKTYKLLLLIAEVALFYFFFNLWDNWSILKAFE